MIDQQRGRSMPLRSLDREVPEIAVRGDAQPRALTDVLVRDTTVAYAFIAPAFFLLLFLVAYPFALSVWLSFSDARVGETGSFVGPGKLPAAPHELDLFADPAELDHLHRAGAERQDRLRDDPGPAAVPDREGSSG